jgi:hypothetical protein
MMSSTADIANDTRFMMPTNSSSFVRVIYVDSRAMNNHTIVSLGAATCFECKSLPASVHCVECAADLCATCAEQSHRSRVLSGHTRKPLAAATKPGPLDGMTISHSKNISAYSDHEVVFVLLFECRVCVR